MAKRPLTREQLDKHKERQRIYRKKIKDLKLVSKKEYRRMRNKINKSQRKYYHKSVKRSPAQKLRRYRKLLSKVGSQMCDNIDFTVTEENSNFNKWIELWDGSDDGDDRQVERGKMMVEIFKFQQQNNVYHSEKLSKNVKISYDNHDYSIKMAKDKLSHWDFVSSSILLENDTLVYSDYANIIDPQNTYQKTLINISKSKTLDFFTPIILENFLSNYPKLIKESALEESQKET
jgi:hypothetical protein